nr:hypothetical protein [Tanacetum cinerariifolium]
METLRSLQDLLKVSFSQLLPQLLNKEKAGEEVDQQYVLFPVWGGEEVDQQYVLFPVWSFGSTNPHNNEEDAAFDGKEHDFDAKKPESEVNVSPSSSAQSKKQDNKTKKEAKGKSLVESFTRYRDLNAEFRDCSDNSKSEDITYSDDEDVVGAEADFNNLESSIPVSPIPTKRIHKDHLVSQIIGDLSLTTQTKSMTRVEEPKRVHQALKDPSWIEAMQEELLQFKMRKVWLLVNLPYGKEPLEEGIDYKEVFAPVARIEAFRLFLAYASFMGFMVYQMDVKSAFLYGTIEEEVYVCQPSGFEDPDHPDKVYKVVKALYGLHQAPRAWYETLGTYLLANGFQRGTIDQTLFIKKQKRDILLVKQKKDGIFISQDKYVTEILRKFGLTEGKSASTPIDTEKPLLKDPDGEDVDVHTYRLMIGSLMYLTSSRPDIMFACKKQTVVATSSTEAEYVAAASCCAQVLWIQNQLLDYGYIKYALTVNPNIYVSCIKQFWNTVVIKQDNDVTRLQALVDKKKVVVTEAAIREVFPLANAEGVDCLPNKEIFAELACMGYEKPSTKLTFYKAFFSSQWKFLIHTILQLMSAKHTSRNEFSSVMASAVICLSTEDTMMDDASNQGRKIDKLDKDDAVALLDDKEEDKKEEKAKVVTAASEIVTVASTTISAAEPQVPAVTITAAPVRVATASTRRRKGVVIRDPEEESTTIIPADTKSKDKGKGIMQKEKEDPTIQRYQVMKKKPLIEAQARRNMIMYLKNVAGFRLDYFKVMSYDDIRLIFEVKFNSNVDFLLNTKEQMEEEESRAIQSINETPA